MSVDPTEALPVVLCHLPAMDKKASEALIFFQMDKKVICPARDWTVSLRAIVFTWPENGLHKSKLKMLKTQCRLKTILTKQGV